MTDFPYTIVQSIEDLPNLSGAKVVYADAETVSGDPKRPGCKPYHGDRAVGWGVTFDDEPMCWYIPLRHKPAKMLFNSGSGNISTEAFAAWANDNWVGKEWRNHNIKFDARIALMDGVDANRIFLHDTLTHVKIVERQRYFGEYGLKATSERWFGRSATERDEVRSFLKQEKSKDYGCVDADVLSEYACSDVHTNRMVDLECKRRRYEGDELIWDIERDVTNTLFRVEQRGVKIDQEALRIDQTEAEIRMAGVETELHCDLGITHLNLSSDASVLEYILKELKLPVLKRTKKPNGMLGGPSVDGEAIELYKDYVSSNSKQVKFFELLKAYREESQFVSLYCNGWQKWVDEHDIIRPSYNQTVETGRMSSRSPNIQQLNGRAKQLIIPTREGYGFIRRDYSQIEYRIIASICNDRRMIDAYTNDRETDFHQFVADICGFGRSFAKHINFGIAYGQGEKGLIRQIARLVGGVIDDSEANRIMSTYHLEFPRIKKVANLATKKCRKRANYQNGEYGWIKTLYGRRRDLRYIEWGQPGFDDSRKAFNTAVQGTAADVIKERITPLEQDDFLQSLDISLRGIIHDEVLMEGPIEEIQRPEVQSHIDRVLCDVSVNIGVPMLTAGGWSKTNWKDAA